VEHITVVVKGGREADFFFRKTLISHRLASFGIDPKKATFEHQRNIENPGEVDVEITVPEDTPDEIMDGLKNHLKVIQLIQNITIIQDQDSEE